MLKDALAELESDLFKQKQEQDYFEFLYNECEETSIVPGELTEKEELLKKLEHAEEIKSTLFSLSQLLSNDNNGIVELSFQAERTVAPISSYTSKLESLAARIGSIQLEIQDLADEVNQLESEVTLEPEQLSMVQDRVNLINQLLQKTPSSD